MSITAQQQQQQPPLSWDNSMMILVDNEFTDFSSSDFSSSDSSSSFTSSSSSQAILQVCQREQREETDRNTNGKLNLIDGGNANANDDDVIMQVDADEGLLNLSDFYDSIAADTSPPEQLLADAVISSEDFDGNSSSLSSSSSSSFFSCYELVEQEEEKFNKTTRNHNTNKKKRKNPYDDDDDDVDDVEDDNVKYEEIQKMMKKLSKSMQKSQATRKSLEYIKDYQRKNQVKQCLQKIEESSRQIETYYRKTTLRTI